MVALIYMIVRTCDTALIIEGYRIDCGVDVITGTATKKALRREYVIRLWAVENDMMVVSMCEVELSREMEVVSTFTHSYYQRLTCCLGWLSGHVR